MKFLKLCSAAFLLLIVNFQIANGCRCGTIPPPCYSYWESEAVFAGRVKRVFKDAEFPFNKVEVDIEENFRGMPFKTAFTYNAGTSCSWTFAEGENILFYAGVNKKSPNEFGTGYCTRTTSYSTNLIDFDFFKQLKSTTPNYWIWGTISQNETEPLEGIKAEILSNGKKITGISDKDGNLRIRVSKAGTYRIRVFLPQNVFLIPPQEYIEGKMNLKEIIKSGTHYVEYEVEVKNNKCGWFDTPVSQPQDL
jgi:hypothetical protein